MAGGSIPVVLLSTIADKKGIIVKSEELAL